LEVNLSRKQSLRHQARLENSGGKMSETNLDCMVTFKGDEATLHEIQSKLTDEATDRPPLANVVRVMIQQILIAAGVTGNFEVEIQHGQIHKLYPSGGGLNAQEWLEKTSGKKP
jgi:hypothetical protein